MRHVVHVLGLMACCLSVPSASTAAVIFLGNVNGNDSLSGVNGRIADYNLANGTTFDLMTDNLAKWNCVTVAGDDCASFSKSDDAVDADLFDVVFDDSSKKSGTWMFAGLPDWFVGAFAIKAGSAYSVFLVDPPQASVGAPGHVWHTFNLFVGRGNNPALSHISWYGFEGELPTCEQDCADQPVPEPALLVLFGVTLLSGGLARRRTRVQ